MRLLRSEMTENGDLTVFATLATHYLAMRNLPTVEKRNGF